MTKEEIAKEIKKAKIEGYNKAQKDFADKSFFQNQELNIKQYKTELDLEEETKSSKSGWLDKYTPILIPVIATIVVSFFGFYGSCQQNSQKDKEILQKDKEIESASAKTLGGLIEKLASDKPLERRYATFAAINLGIKDFDKYVMTSLSSTEDIGTFEILLDRLKKNQEDETEVRRKLSLLYSMKAEELGNKNQEDKVEQLAQLAINILPKNKTFNALAHYRLGEIIKQRGDFPAAIIKFSEALSDLDKEGMLTLELI